jgi:hypothetical protein
MKVGYLVKCVLGKGLLCADPSWFGKPQRAAVLSV